MGSCSSSESSSRQEEAKVIQWSDSELAEVKSGCEAAVAESVPEWTTTQANYYCGCVVEEAAKRWPYEEYTVHENAFIQRLWEDGTAGVCYNTAEAM